MRILNKITELAMLMSIAVSAASCNKITLFDEAFVAFDTAKSSVVSINATGEFTGSYTLHYTGPKPSAPIVVNFVVDWRKGLTTRWLRLAERLLSCPEFMSRLSKSTGFRMRLTSPRTTRLP